MISWANSASKDVTHVVLQRHLEVSKTTGAIDYMEQHIYDPVSSNAEKFNCAFCSLTVAKHWRQQDLPQVCKTRSDTI